ncbi:ASCH domain-containing protein [Prolixibacteraceae bacterium JC049]|nr:ASCH domain-containing protein [Prolixibacteraceae bacterium JC049]
MTKKNNQVCIMSIKPKFFNLISEGNKLVEYRKVSPKKTSKIYLYVSRPVKRICGIIEVEKIETGTIQEIWSKTKKISGIESSEYFDYCGNKETITALYIEKFTPIKATLPSTLISNFRAPQNYFYHEEFSTLV